MQINQECNTATKSQIQEKRWVLAKKNKNDANVENTIPRAGIRSAPKLVSFLTADLRPLLA